MVKKSDPHEISGLMRDDQSDLRPGLLAGNTTLHRVEIAA
jgi:hypothetical protein